MVNIINQNSKTKIFMLRSILLGFMIFLLAGLMLVYPEASFDGVKSGVSICLEKIIPSLFPFLVLTTVALDSGIVSFLASRCKKVMWLLFRLSGASAPIIIMSLIGGYPVGAILASNACDKGLITERQARKLLLFCVNPGPAFVISMVGVSMLGNKNSGMIIYLATILSSILTGIVLRFFDSETTFKNSENPDISHKLNEFDLSSSISKAVMNMSNICVWIVIFSSFNSFLELLPLNSCILEFYKLISEITVGISLASTKYPLPVISSLVSFSGICVHIQLLPYIYKLRLKYIYFLSVRVVASFFSGLITYIIIRCFPGYCEVISLGTKPQHISFNASFPVCVWFMLMCGLFIIGDNYILRIKNKR